MNSPKECNWQQPPSADRDGDSHSSDSGEKESSVKKTRLTANSFATILAEVIETPGYEDAIHWSQDGKSFRVIPKLFTEQVLEKRMRGTKFSSFFRRLIRWGFERVVLDEFPMDAFVFRHAMFQRGRASLLRTLSPYQVSRGRRAQRPSVERAPRKEQTKAERPPREVVTRNDTRIEGSIHPSASMVSIPPRREQNDAALFEMLMRQQQQELLLSRTRDPVSLLRSQLQENRTVDLHLLAREIHFQNLLLRTSNYFGGNCQLPIERLALLLLQQQDSSVVPTRPDELLRLVSLMQRLQQQPPNP